MTESVKDASTDYIRECWLHTLKAKTHEFPKGTEITPALQGLIDDGMAKKHGEKYSITEKGTQYLDSVRVKWAEWSAQREDSIGKANEVRQTG